MRAVLPKEIEHLNNIVKPYLNKMGKLSDDAPQKVREAHERMKAIIKELQGY